MTEKTATVISPLLLKNDVRVLTNARRQKKKKKTQKVQLLVVVELVKMFFLDFSIRCYGKTRNNFLANTIKSKEMIGYKSV